MVAGIYFTKQSCCCFCLPTVPVYPFQTRAFCFAFCLASAFYPFLDALTVIAVSPISVSVGFYVVIIRYTSSGKETVTSSDDELSTAPESAGTSTSSAPFCAA